MSKRVVQIELLQGNDEVRTVDELFDYLLNELDNHGIHAYVQTVKVPDGGDDDEDQ